MSYAVCEECLECWNYLVCEVGCFGSSVPCDCWVGDYEEEMEEYDDSE